MYLSGLTHPQQVGATKLTIVTFHRVLPAPALAEYPLAGIAVSVEEFQWFIQFFTRYYTCGSLVQIYDRWHQGETPDKPFLAITFDDGQLDNFRYALPVLTEAGVTASFYIPVGAIDHNETLWHDRVAYAGTQLLGQAPQQAQVLFAELGVTVGKDANTTVHQVITQLKPKPALVCREWVARLEKALAQPSTSNGYRPDWDGMMTWEQLRTLVAQGHEVGSHSLSHSILTNVDAAQLTQEVTGSRQRLQAMLDQPISSFCYPNGDCNDQVVAAVRQAGYPLAVTTRWGANDQQADPLRLTRFDMSSQHTRDRHGQMSQSRLAFRLSPYFPAPQS